jgi:cellobiose transport system permease protein
MTTRTAGEKFNPVTGFVFYAILIAGAVVSLFPFYWMAVIASSERTAAFRMPPKIVPGTRLIENLEKAFQRIDFFQSLWNSLVVAGLTTVSVLFFCSLGGYAFAKLRFPGKKFLFGFVLFTLLVPSQLSVLPVYYIMAKLSWIDSYKALIVPSMVNAFGIFWMRQYIAGAMHTELIEAARIDGCSHIRVYWNVAVPIILPAFATLGIFTFLNVWNDFFWPLVILKNESKYTIQLALSQLHSIREGVDYGMIMAATLLATLPLLIVFLLFSRWFIAGITSGAVKS